MGTSNIAFLLAHDTAAPTQLSVLNALLGAMRAIKADPQNAAQEWHEILDDLAKAIDANAKPAAVSAAEWTLLQAEWGELKDRLREQLPAALRPLTYKLAEVAAATFPPATEKGLITYPVTSSRTAAQPVLVGGMQFHAEGAASASASAELQVYTSAPAWTAKGGYSLPQSEALATLRVRGNLGVTGSASSPQPWGAIQVGGSAKASASLRYGFDYPSSRYLAQALIDTFPQLAAPGDLSRTLQACQGQDFGIIHLNVNGELALNASLSAGHAFVEHIGAGKTLERIADARLKPAKVGVSVGAKVGFSWKIAGDFDLSVVRKDGGALVTLERQAHRNTGASVDVGAEIDIQGLQGMLDPVM